jgi:hypothetical protein
MKILHARKNIIFTSNLLVKMNVFKLQDCLKTDEKYGGEAQQGLRKADQ